MGFNIGGRVRRMGRMGTIVSLEQGRDNGGKSKPAARVLWDNEKDGVENPFTGKIEPAYLYPFLKCELTLVTQ